MALSYVRMPLENLLSHGAVGEAGRKGLEELRTVLGSDKYSFLGELKEHFGPGIDICLTGGAVRDAILGIPLKDLDFVISLKGFSSDHAAAVSAFESFFGKRRYDDPSGAENGKWHIGSKWGRFAFVGEKFGVYRLHLKGYGEDVDIAFPRIEKPIDGTLRGSAGNFMVYPDATMPVEKDLPRRDFTINCMGLFVDYEGRPGHGRVRLEFTDLFGGLDCIARRTIRTILDPSVTLGDDLSRIFRAIRLACKLGFAIDEPIWHAIGALACTINAKGPDGKFLLKRETLSAEVLKAFYHSPTRAFDILSRSFNGGDGVCLLEIIFPDLFDDFSFTGRDMNFIVREKREWYRQKYSISKLSRDDERVKNRSIKSRARARAREMLDLATRGGDPAFVPSLETIMAIIFHDSGETARLEEERRKKGRFIYPGCEALSCAIWQRSHSTMRMSGLPPGNDRYNVDAREVIRLINGIHDLYPLLGDDLDRCESDKKIPQVKNIARMMELLPEGPNDELFVLFKLDCMAEGSIAASARDRLPDFISFVKNWYDNYESLKSRYGVQSVMDFRKGLSKSLQLHFMAGNGPEFSRLIKIGYVAFIKYLSNLVGNDRDYDEIAARRSVFDVVVTHPHLRKQWEKALMCESGREARIYPELKAFSSCREEEEARRDLLYIIERVVFFRYTGGIYEGRGKDAAAGPMPGREAFFANRLMRSIRTGDLDLIGLIERHSARACKGPGPKFFDLVLPDITSMIGIEQPSRYHSEGDVWRHTVAVFENAIKLLNEKKINCEEFGRLAPAVIFHDTGKALTISTNEHGEKCFYGHEAESANVYSKFIELFPAFASGPCSSAEIERIKRAIACHGSAAQKVSSLKGESSADVASLMSIFPEGRRDVAYHLLLCDSRATINAAGFSKYQELSVQFGRLEKILEIIDGLRGKGIEPEALTANDRIRYLVKDRSNASDRMSVCLAYHEFLIRSGRTGMAEDNVSAFLDDLFNGSSFGNNADLFIRYMRERSGLLELSADALRRAPGMDEKKIRAAARKDVSEFLGSYFKTRIPGMLNEEAEVEKIRKEYAEMQIKYNA